MFSENEAVFIFKSQRNTHFSCRIRMPSVFSEMEEIFFKMFQYADGSPPTTKHQLVSTRFGASPDPQVRLKGFTSKG